MKRSVSVSAGPKLWGGTGKLWSSATVSALYRAERRQEMKKQVYGAKDLQELLGVSESKAYAYIRQMNAELQEKGFLTVRGRVPAAYVKERFFGVTADESA